MTDDLQGLYVGYLLLCFLATVVAVGIEIRARHRSEEPMEYLSTWSEARRARRAVPRIYRRRPS